MRHHRLENFLLDILMAHPLGIGEYQLIVMLQNPPYSLFDKNAMSEPLSLFQSHFVLFHSLYQIRAHTRASQQFDLQIETSNIKLLPYIQGVKGLATVDKLQQYYLDWQNFSATTEQDVDSLLRQFWSRMAASRNGPNIEAVTQAYHAFDLPFDSELNEVKSAYRRLQHVYHPDKGGDKGQSQHIETQFQLLKTYLKQN